jgi:hypothetical protein
MRRIIPSLLVVLSLASCAAPAPRDQPGPSAEPDVLAALAGSWTGVLEYADYQSDRRVQLPTRITAVADGASRTLTLDYVYREPNGESVTSRGEHAINVAAGRYVMGSDTFAIDALHGFAAGGEGRLVVTGTVMENDRPQPARHTITLTGDSLRILKETRSPWQFRNEYRMTRESPPR